MTKRLLTLIRKKWLRQSVILLCVCLLLGAILNNPFLFDMLNVNWVDVNIRNAGLNGMLHFVVIGTIACVIGVPRQLVAFLGGYAFGFVMGAILATLTAGLGCILSLYFSRLVVRDYVKHKFPKKIANIDRFISTQPITKTIIIRLLPVGNNLITNLAAGISGVSSLHFLIGSLVGYFPQMAIFALMGKGVIVLSVWKIGLSITLFVISSLLSIRLYRQYKATRLLDDEVLEPENNKDDKQVI